MAFNDDKQLMQIGRFIRTTQLSRKALRLYEQLGILRPIRIDADSGYRYYSQDQIDQARLIRLLREMDMPLRLVQEVISADATTACHLVEAYQQTIAKRSLVVNQTAIVVQHLLKQESLNMAFEVKVKDIPAQTVVSHNAKVKIDEMQAHIKATLGMLREHILAGGANIAGDPICMYHGPVNKEADGPIEICWSYKGTLEANESVSVRSLPAHKLAYHHADPEHSHFPNILQVWTAVVDWAKENGYETMPQGLECYEVWPEDLSVIVGWPLSNDQSSK